MTAVLPIGKAESARESEYDDLMAERALLRTILRCGLVVSEPDDDLHVLTVPEVIVLPAAQAVTARRVCSGA